MKANSTWYANSQRIRILMMSVISGHDIVLFTAYDEIATMMIRLLHQLFYAGGISKNR